MDPFTIAGLALFGVIGRQLAKDSRDMKKSRQTTAECRELQHRISHYTGEPPAERWRR